MSDKLKSYLESTYDKLRYFCPSCGMELEGNAIGDAHISPEQGSKSFPCEYKVTETSVPPVSTLDRLNLNLESSKQLLAELPIRIALLESIQSKLRLEAEANEKSSSDNGNESRLTLVTD